MVHFESSFLCIACAPFDGICAPFLRVNPSQPSAAGVCHSIPPLLPWQSISISPAGQRWNGISIFTSRAPTRTLRAKPRTRWTTCCSSTRPRPGAPCRRRAPAARRSRSRPRRRTGSIGVLNLVCSNLGPRLSTRRNQLQTLVVIAGKDGKCEAFVVHRLNSKTQVF